MSKRSFIHTNKQACHVVLGRRHEFALELYMCSFTYYGVTPYSMALRGTQNNPTTSEVILLHNTRSAR